MLSRTNLRTTKTWDWLHLFITLNLSIVVFFYNFEMFGWGKRCSIWLAMADQSFRVKSIPLTSLAQRPCRNFLPHFCDKFLYPCQPFLFYSKLVAASSTSNNYFPSHFFSTLGVFGDLAALLQINPLVTMIEISRVVWAGVQRKIMNNGTLD